MSDLEAKMAEALSGKFFWEGTSDMEDCRVPEIIDIRRAQRKFSAVGNKFAIIRSSKGDPTSIDSKHEISYLADCIAKVHGCDSSDFTEKSLSKSSSVPKRHYNWSLLRYYPTMSASRISAIIGRNHATIIQSAKRFEVIKDNYKEQIRLVDEYMWS